ncbi:MAG TPA: GIY-YIG nuclease family protein, partial [Planctomycetota bacterium]|nr:GIY-YIG nuclease family protein [Planctomycetota bacterium]
MSQESRFDAGLLEKIGRFPGSPGVYVMKDGSSRIIYIGKAVNLRSRVRSYFGASSDTRLFYRFLVAKIADVDCIVTQSEAEALILENNLIKKHRPVYNIRLKDDKTYVSIKVT